MVSQTKGEAVTFKSIYEQLKIASTATLTTVLKRRGLHYTFMHDVTPLRENSRMAGTAFTLRYIPCREDLDTGEVDNLTDVQRLAIEQVSEGEVLVVDARGDTRAGIMGDILSTRVQVRGAAGSVTDGAFRDSPSIAELDIAAYARAMNAHSNKTVHHASELQVPIACGGVAVFPGDVIVGDGEGVVVIPQGLAAEVADEAIAQEEKEEFILQKVHSGSSILGVYPPDEKTMAEYQAWREKKDH